MRGGPYESAIKDNNNSNSNNYNEQLNYVWRDAKKGKNEWQSKKKSVANVKLQWEEVRQGDGDALNNSECRPLLTNDAYMQNNTNKQQQNWRAAVNTI